MDHTLYFDGNQKKIAWIILTKDSKIEQEREHVDIYLDKVTVEQSKHIALHVGIFWCIGRFIIKNEDTVNVMLDSESMREHLSGQPESTDPFIKIRDDFIKQLIEQRKLKVHYHMIDSKENLAAKLL